MPSNAEELTGSLEDPTHSVHDQPIVRRAQPSNQQKKFRCQNIVLKTRVSHPSAPFTPKIWWTLMNWCSTLHQDAPDIPRLFHFVLFIWRLWITRLCWHVALTHTQPVCKTRKTAKHDDWQSWMPWALPMKLCASWLQNCTWNEHLEVLFYFSLVVTANGGHDK